MVFPVVLGTGKRLFGETSDKKPLSLTDSKTVGEGVGAGGRIGRDAPHALGELQGHAAHCCGRRG